MTTPPFTHLDSDGRARMVNVGEKPITVRATAKTGVEMEALVAASIAALTVYDMCKALDRSMEIVHVGLWFKDGGAGGRYQRNQD